MNQVLRGGAVALTIMTLASCNGVSGASNYTKQLAYDASFQQRPLVDPDVEDNRVLTMFVFRQGAGARRNGYSVKFNASAN